MSVPLGTEQLGHVGQPVRAARRGVGLLPGDPLGAPCERDRRATRWLSASAPSGSDRCHFHDTRTQAHDELRGFPPVATKPGDQVPHSLAHGSPGSDTI
jgi:hypothetical protein